MKVSEIFFSIEGEGITIGYPEVFLRLSGCNMRCEWCDTKYSFNTGTDMTSEEILNGIYQYPTKRLSITGGEPLLQKKELNPFIQHLKEEGYWIQINTNGTIYEEDIFTKINLINMDVKCPSSGMNSNLSVIERTRLKFNIKSQFKFVIVDRDDYQYARDFVRSLNAANMTFQPEWGHRGFTQEIIEMVKKDELNVRVILQQHKFIWGEKKGV